MKVLALTLAHIAFPAFAVATIAAEPQSASAATPEETSDRDAGIAALLTPGQSIEAALSALTRAGHRIAYSSATVRPGMTLVTRPRARTIEGVLAEMLAPWRLEAVRAANGDWLIVRAPIAGAASRSSGSVAPAAGNIAETPLGEIDVVATRFAVADTGAPAEIFLTRDEVRRLPHLMDDAVRMLNGLPGVAGGDISAQLNVRGGRRDEVLVLIDGAEIRDPFHIREASGAISLVDTNLVQDMRLVSGGATADLGYHMSGVLDITTLEPRVDDGRHGAFGVSFINAFARSQGTFDGGRGRWLASARRGYLDLVMRRIQDDDEEFTPRYQDALAKLAWDLGPRTTLAAHVLLGTDELTFVEADGSRSSGGDAETGTLWLTLDHGWSEALRVATIVTGGRTDRKRAAQEDRPQELIADLRDSARFDFGTLRQDWTWQPGSEHLVKWGVAAATERAEYDYRRVSMITDPFLAGDQPVDTSRQVVLDTDLQSLGGYAAWRTRLADALVMEAGARWDRWRHADAGSFDRASPRVNLLYQPDEQREIRVAWGSVHQPHGIDELQVEDGETAFFAPERAEQIAVGFLQRLGASRSLRVDLYRKRYSNLRPQFANLFDPIELIPEAEPDRIRIDAQRARAYGIEVTLRGAIGEHWGGWLSYAYAQAQENEGDVWRPRFWDQRHSASMNLSWEGAKWRASLSGIYHSAWPTTDLDARVVSLPGGGTRIEPVLGPRNGERLDTFLRLDLRASREVRLKNGALTFYFEVFNLLNTRNACCTEEFDLRVDPDGTPRVVPELDYWLPLLPSFGVQYEF